MFCSKCGKKLKDDAKFCSGCGSPITASSASVQVREKPAQPQPPAPIPREVSQRNQAFQDGVRDAAPAMKAAAKTAGKGGLIAGISALAVILVVAVVVVVVVSGGLNHNKPFDTVKKLADGYNQLDYNKIVDCFDPRITDTISGMVNGAASFLGLPTTGSDSAAAAASLMGDMMSGYAKDYWGEQGVSATMTVREISTVMDGSDKAKVTAEFTVTWSTGEKESWQETISMVKTKGNWYITLDWSNIMSMF